MDVSVIIPTLNEEKYLAACLDSLAKQTFSGSHEVIIGDGCSTDKTLAIAAEYGAKVVVEPKPTIAAGRQKACDAAKGRIIISTDADIHAPATWIDNIYSNFDSNAGMYGNIIPYDGSRQEQWFCKHVMHGYMQLMDWMHIPSPVGANLAFKRAAFEQTGGFNTDMRTAEDLDIVRKLSRIGRVAYNPFGVVYVSLRRVRGWGYGRYVAFHLSNAIKYNATGKSHDSYEPVR